MADATDGAGADWPTLEDKIRYLSGPAAHGGAAVDIRETQMAWVFLAGDRAWKLKKPIRIDVLDYSTLEARGRICAEEVRLNRRLAPDVYLGTARLTAEAAGRLAIDGAGETVDWLVVMRRLADADMLDRAIRAGRATQPRVAAVADRLGAFYRRLPAEPVDPLGHVARFMTDLEISREVFAGPRFGEVAARAGEITTGLAALLDGDPALLTERVTAGRIVEGHGDLRPEHVCLETPPVIIDCLEFTAALRLVDPFEELCFLGMECAVLGARWIGPMLVERVAAALGDRPPDRLLAFYTAWRAILRARQALAHLMAPVPRTPEKWQPLAARYVAEAETALSALHSGALPGED